MGRAEQMNSAEHKEIVTEIRAATKLELDALTRLIKRLGTIKNEFDKKHNDRVSFSKEKLAERLSDYKTVEEAHEAYGWDIISEAEYNQIREAIIHGTEAAEQDTVYSIMSGYLSQTLQRWRGLQSEFKYELMTESEKAAHDESVANWRAEVEKIKKNRS